MRRDQLNARIAALAVPALGSLVVEPLYTLTDTAIVGHLGRSQLGGLALATSILNVALYAFGFLSMATAPRVAFCLGRHDRRGAAGAAASATTLAAIMGVIVGAVILAAAHPLAVLFGGRGASLQAATTYLRVSAAGVPFYLGIQAGNGYSRGLSDTRTPLVILLTSNAANALLEVVFVYAFGWGLLGSALGTVIAQMLAGSWFARLTASRVAAAGGGWRPQRAEIVRLLRAGLVLTVRTLALLGALSGSTAVAARLGASVLGGHQIGLQVWFLVALALDALAVPAQVLVGEALGRGDTQRAVEVSRRVVAGGVAVGTVVGAVTAALSPLLPSLFPDSPAVAHQAMLAILVGSLSLPLCSVAFTLDGVLLGAGDYAFLRLAMLVALAGFVPLAAATLVDHRLGVGGVWLALTCWVATRAAVLGRRWRSGQWLGAPVVAPAGAPPSAGPGAVVTASRTTAARKAPPGR